MSNVTQINKAKKLRRHTRSFRKTLRWMKERAHRSYRRASKQAVKTGQEIDEKPRLSSWDIV
jgi:hypothetical protein